MKQYNLYDVDYDDVNADFFLRLLSPVCTQQHSDREHHISDTKDGVCAQQADADGKWQYDLDEFQRQVPQHLLVGTRQQQPREMDLQLHGSFLDVSAWIGKL